MNVPLRPRSGRRGSAAGRVIGVGSAAALIVAVLALAGCSGSLRESRARAAERDRGSAFHATFTLMQMNLCLSGLAGCFAKVDYPAVLREAISVIRRERPDAVTFNESCRGDDAVIARQTGYQLRFSTVIYLGTPLPCIHPRGRGVFGDAVLSRASITSSQAEPFNAQSGVERRVWLCVNTRAGIQVCTAHLNTRMTIERPGNDEQCAELRAILARRAAGRPLIFGGDVNRSSACAPAGWWTRTDRAARQSPGLQQVYGTGLGSPQVEVIPATHTDHDILLVGARLVRRRTARLVGWRT